MIAIVAALSREIAALVQGSQAEPALLQHGVHLYQLPNALVVAGGMGAERVTAAVSAARQHAPISMLVSTGLAGACASSVQPGEVAEAEVVIDVRTGERFRTDVPAQRPALTLVSSPSIASVHEKDRLHQSYGAHLVDMEAATVARLARAHGLGFRAMKAVSDAHDFELASLSRLAGKHGTFRTGRFALHTAVRPHTWRKTMSLGRHSTHALSALHKALADLLTAP